MAKGTIVNLALHGIHYDPNCEPAQFKRFSRENKNKILPRSYSPFGIRSRACIDFRFAPTDAKQAVAKLVGGGAGQFRAGPGTEYPPEPLGFKLIINVHLNARQRH